ncbi:fibronectin type III domain-containing protein (plasmid) [Paenibacillus sp. EC2-1]|uniref:fibronectin type III domain-containing protein n=1 Tax=Paenibacillus sp. EC2-1 TaxID=3388665 RepID=UPI003BEEF655
MATQRYNATLYGEGSYFGDRFVSGQEIHEKWNIFNVKSDNRSVWGTTSDGWIQYRSNFGTGASRYNETDLDLGDTYFDVDVQPLGSGSYEVGFFFRFRERLQTYYYVTYNGGWRDWGGNNIRLHRVTNGTASVVAEYACPVFTIGTTYTFRCDMQGSRFKISLGGKLIIDYTDPVGSATKGAFGPYVIGQEFAKWRGFQTKSLNAYTVMKEFRDLSVGNLNNTPDLSVLVHPDPVGDILLSEVMKIVSGTYVSHIWKSFRLTSNNPKAIVIFDKQANVNITGSPAARIFAYNDYAPAAPLPPSNPILQAVDANTIQLSWSHPADDDTETGFHILDENDNVIGSVGADVFRFIETNLDENTTYKRRVLSFNAYGESPPTDIVVVTTPKTIPVAPSNLQSVTYTDKKIHWSWSDNSINEDAFELVAWDEGVDTVVATLPADKTEYVETGLLPLTTYVRSVRAVNAVGVSPESNFVQVTTKDIQIDPPTEAPINFYGVGISDKSIYWSWEDIVNSEEYFELLDKDNKLIATIPANSTFHEEKNLVSAMYYYRKIRAVNKGGVGPSSALAIGKTLSEGNDHSDRPSAPYNMGVDVIDTVTARVFWEYTANQLYAAAGFKIYSSDGLMMAAVPADQQEFLFSHLQPNTTYRFFVVSYNDNGNSASSNIVSFVTPHVVEPIPPPDIPDEKEEEYADVSYDHEQEDTGKIEAFQSGVGDYLDLKVSNLPSSLNVERFNFTVGIKGFYDEQVDRYHPAVAFQIKIVTNGRQKFRIRKPDGSEVDEYLPYYDATDWIDASVNGQNTKDGRDPEPFTYPVSKGIPFNIEDLSYRVEIRMNETEKIAINDPTAPIQWALSKSATDTTNDSSDYLVVTSDRVDNRRMTRSWESPLASGGPLEVSEGKEIHFTKYIRSAHLQYGWRADIYGCKLVITPSNPNVEIVLESEVLDFTPNDSTIIEVKMKARIVNETQALWYPSIHSGYFYMNQQENYLYVDDRVRPKDGDIDTTYVLQFPYTIKAYGQRFHPQQDLVFSDSEKPDFLQGKVGGGLSLDMYSGSMTLADKATAAGFISRLMTFGNPVTSWHQLSIDQDDQMITDGAKLKVEVVRCDENGNYNESDWMEQANNVQMSYPLSPPVDRLRYRLTLESGEKKRNYTPTLRQGSQELASGYLEHLVISEDSLSIGNADLYAEGLFITRPIDLGRLINSLGKIKLRMATPNGSSARFYSVTGSSESDAVFYDRTKWTPLAAASQNGDEYTFDVMSSYLDTNGAVERPCLAIAIELVRGSVEQKNKTVWNKTEFGAGKATNLIISGDTIKLSNPAEEGVFISPAIYLGTISKFGEVVTSLLETYEGSQVIVQTVTGNSKVDVENAARIESEWRTVQSGVVQSAIKTWMMYRIKIRSGKKDRRVVTFEDDTAAQWDSHANRSNVDIVPAIDDYIQLGNPRVKGSYVSEQFDLGYQDRIHPIKVSSPDISSLKLSVSYKVNGVWESEKVVVLDTNGVGQLPQSGASHLRYTLDLLPITKTSLVTHQYTESQLRTGATIPPNVQVSPSGAISLIDAKDNDVYTSPTFDASDVIQYLRLEHTIDTPGQTSVLVQVATNDIDNDWSKVTWHSVDTSGAFTADRRKYFRFKVTLIGSLSADTTTYVSPTIRDIKLVFNGTVYSSPVVYRVGFDVDQFDKASPAINEVSIASIQMKNYTPTVFDIRVMPDLYSFVKVSPIIHSVTLGGHVAAGNTVENYVVPMTAELITDGVQRDLTVKTAEEIVKDYLASNGIDNSSMLSFTDYLLEWDSTSYPVEMFTNTSGNQVIRGRSTANVGDVLYRNVRIYFDETTRSTVLRPVPQSGSPIVVRNAAGKLLRHTHFRDENGNPTLTNLEMLETNESLFIFLSFQDIDPTSLNVSVDINGVGEFTEIPGCTIQENRLRLPNRFLPGRQIKVLYKLKDSYFIDWNYAPDEDWCLLRLHTDFNPNDKDTRRLDVKYEINKDTSYYLAKEIDLNPLKNRLNSGFIYLSDIVYAPAKIEIEHNPNVLYKNKEDRVTVSARVLDRHGNPLVGRKLIFSTDVGSIRAMNTNFTDENGMVTAIFSTAGMTNSFADKTIITITEESTKMTAETTIYFIEEKFVNKIAIVTENNAVNQSDVVKLKIITLGANSERLPNRGVSFRIWKDSDLTGASDPQPIVNTTGQTDINGEYLVYYQISDSFLTEGDAYLLIEADTYDKNGKLIVEHMMINVSMYKKNLDTPMITAVLN